MAITDQLGAPPTNAHLMGRYALHRFVRCEATAAAATAVAWTNMSYIVAVDVGEPTWDYEVDVYQQGAGDNKTHIRRGPRWDGTITVLAGKIGTVLAQFKGATWTTAGAAVMSLRMDDDDPEIIIESVMRDADNTDHLFTRVIQDIIIDDMGDSSPLDYSDKVIPFHTYHEPFLLCADAQMVYHVYNATPGTATYTQSSGTPLTLVTATSHDDWHYDNMVFCKVKDNSAGDTIGKRVTSGVALSGGTLTFTTGTPAASDKVYILFAVAV